MTRFNSNVGSLKSPLQQAPEVFNPIGVNLTVNVSLHVIHNVMDEVVANLVISDCLIGIDLGAVLYLFQQGSLQSLALDVWNYLCADLTEITVKHSHDDSFSSASASPSAFLCDVALAAILVHIPKASADIGLIGFDRTRTSADLALGSKLLSVERQAKANAMQHKPCRLLGNADSLGDLVRRDTILAVGQHPNGSEPLIGRDGRILHDGANLCRELPLWMYALALPLALILQEYNVSPTAPGAVHDAIREAKALHVLHCIVGIREKQNRILQGLWFLCFAVHVRNIEHRC